MVVEFSVQSFHQFFWRFFNFAHRVRVLGALLD